MAHSISREVLQELRGAASDARQRCYPRYSGFQVSAAVERTDGEIYGGANVEVVNLTLTKHAEEMAVMAAIADGALGLGDRWLQAVYVVGAPPCGGCRQFLWEWAAADAVCVIDRDGEAEVRRLDELLPDAFGPEALPDRRGT